MGTVYGSGLGLVSNYLCVCVHMLLKATITPKSKEI